MNLPDELIYRRIDADTYSFDLSVSGRELKLAAAARAFANADYELETSVSPDPGVVVKSMAARHDMRLLCGLPCGCEESTCAGLLS